MTQRMPTLLAIAVFAVIIAAPLAQVPGAPTAPAAPGAGRGGRGAAPDPTPLSIIQQLALAREMTLPAALTAAQAAAAAALVEASLTLPTNQADLEAKARALAEADLAIANARAAAFERVQRSLQPLSAAQIATYSSTAGTGRGGRGGAAPAANWETVYFDRTGFTPLFDGKTLTNWERESDAWEVVDGTIHHRNTPENVNMFGQHHIAYVGPGAVMSDFDLRVEYKVRGGNAGIQYRSRYESGLRAQDGEQLRDTPAARLRPVAAAMADPIGKPLPPTIKKLSDAWGTGFVPPNTGGNGVGNPWQVSGYQFDITGAGTGAFYEGQGRGTVGPAGDIVMLLPDNGRVVLGKVVDLPWVQFGNEGDWNRVQIIARGNTLVHMLNGRVVTVVIDDDPARRAMKGFISLQLESPTDCEVWYRNVWVKPL
jgi:hypothetical protein